MDYNKDELFRAAAALAAKGWKLVRLWGVTDDGSCNCGKRGCTNGGKHPHGGVGWQHRATDDEDEIMRWFDESHEQARSNIGVRLGPSSGIIDVEFDSAEGEAAIHNNGLDVIDTPAYSSGRGVHRIFMHEDWMPDSGVVKVEGVEVRIGGGETASQSVIPPSWHRSGKQYNWLPGKSPEEVNPARLPAVFREKVMAASRRQGSGIMAQAVESLRAGKKWGEGDRHPNLVGVASKLAGLVKHYTDADRELVTTLLLCVNATQCVPPKSEAEVIKIATDQFNYYRDRKIEKRASRPYERWGLAWNEDDRCWEPGQWKLTVVHVDPAQYKLRIPNIDRSEPPYIVRLSVEATSSAKAVRNAIQDTTKRINMHDPSAARWAAMWTGDSERDENGVWRDNRGLWDKLLDDADDEYPPAHHGEMAEHAEILLAHLADTSKIEVGDDTDNRPNHSGAPKWIRGRDGSWRMYIKWGAAFRGAWAKARVSPVITKAKQNVLKERVLQVVGETEYTSASRVVGGVHGKWWLLDDRHLDALRQIAGTSE